MFHKIILNSSESKSVVRFYNVYYIILIVCLFPSSKKWIDSYRLILTYVPNIVQYGPYVWACLKNDGLCQLGAFIKIFNLNDYFENCVYKINGVM